MLLALDLSSKVTGWSKFSSDGKLVTKGRIIPSPEIGYYQKIHYIVQQIRDLYKNVNELVIEDIYYGKNVKSLIYLARISGAVAYSWIDYKYKEPHFYTASQARKIIGLKGNAHKAEIQIAMIKKYEYAPKTDIKEYELVIDILKEELEAKKITKGQFKYRMDKLSGRIDEETGCGEDQCDAIVLGLAYCKEDK